MQTQITSLWNRIAVQDEAATIALQPEGVPVLVIDEEHWSTVKWDSNWGLWSIARMRHAAPAMNR